MKNFYTLLFLFFSISLLGQEESSLVAHYSFDGNADDISGNENHGSVDGPLLTTDRFGNQESAYEFDGEDDIIRVLDAASLRLEEDFTIVAWFMPYSVKDHTILRKNSSQNKFPAKLAYGIGLAGTQKFVMNIGTDEQSNGIASRFENKIYEPDQWYQIIARKQDTTIYLTTNKFETGSFQTYPTTIEGNIQYDTSPFLIGSRTQQAANTFDGKIDDIKIYNRFMTLEEVTGLSFDDDEVDEEMVEDDNPQNDDDDDDEIPDDGDDDDDGNIEDENENGDAQTKVTVVIDPWMFLLIQSENSIIENIKLSKDGTLLLNQNNNSNVASVNLEGYEAGDYLLTLKLSDDDYEQIITIE